MTLGELFEVVAEDEEILVINKPAGLVCHPTKGDEYSSLISRARLYLGAADAPHLINRLDRETSGLVVIAKNVETAAGLRRLWARHQVHKEYLAIVHGHLERAAIMVDAPIGKDQASAIAIKDTVTAEGASAVTRIYTRARFRRAGADYSLVRVLPLTGRKHQIRIHLSHIGHSIVGDKLYGMDENLYLDFVSSRLTAAQREVLVLEHHALHAGLLSLEWRGGQRTYACLPEPWFREFARTGE